MMTIAITAVRSSTAKTQPMLTDVASQAWNVWPKSVT